ncbi:MAG TPA: hypothetical protein GXZ47_09420 [Treponema sp.]|nr:hypothetical protein [Treponema sp.]
MDNLAKRFFSFALILLLVNIAHFVSSPPPAYKKALPVYMNIELSEQNVWKVEVQTQSKKRLDFDDLIRYYVRIIRGKRHSINEVNRILLPPTTELSGQGLPIVIADEIARGKVIQRISLKLSAGMNVEDIDGITLSIGEKIIFFDSHELKGLAADEKGMIPLLDSIGHPDKHLSLGLNRLGPFNDFFLFLTNPLSSPTVLFYTGLLWMLLVFFKNRSKSSLDMLKSGIFPEKTDISRKMEIAILIVLTSISFLIRINKISQMNIFSDELYAVITADPNKSFLFTFTDAGNPPFYYILLRIWSSIWGWTEVSGKVLSVLIGSLSVLSIWYLIRNLLGKTPALIAAAFMTVSSYAVGWSHVIRTYALLLLLTPLVITFFLKYLREKKFRHLMLYTIASIILVNSHYYGVFVVLANAILSLLFQIQSRSFSFRKNIGFLLANIVIALSLAPFLLYMGIQEGLMNSAYNDMDVPSSKLLRVVFFTYKIIAYIGGFFSSNIIMFIVFCIIIVFLLRTLFQKENLGESLAKYRFALWYSLGFCVIIILLAFFVSIFRPMMKEKYFIVLYPSIITILTLFFCPIYPKSYTPIKSILFVLLLLGFSGDMYYPSESDVFHETAEFINLDSTRYHSFAVQEHIKKDKAHGPIYNQYFSFFTEGKGNFDSIFSPGKSVPEMLYGHPFANGPIPEQMTHCTKVFIRDRYVTKYYSQSLLSEYAKK